jgi:hypothetical protein
MIITTKELEAANLSEKQLDRADLSNANLCKANLTHSTLRHANLSGANLKEANLLYTILFRANLENSSLMDANLQYTRLVEVNLTNANLCSCNLLAANLRSANLTNANLHLVDLSGADLTGAILAGVIGLADKSSEVSLAKKLLDIFDRGEGSLDQASWDKSSYRFSRSLTSWICPDLIFPGPKASRMCPTLAKFFFSPNEEVMDALRLVAAGELSVFPD